MAFRERYSRATLGRWLRASGIDTSHRMIVAAIPELDRHIGSLLRGESDWGQASASGVLMWTWGWNGRGDDRPPAWLLPSYVVAASLFWLAALQRSLSRTDTPPPPPPEATPTQAWAA